MCVHEIHRWLFHALNNTKTVTTLKAKKIAQVLTPFLPRKMN